MNISFKAIFHKVSEALLPVPSSRVNLEASQLHKDQTRDSKARSLAGIASCSRICVYLDAGMHNKESGCSAKLLFFLTSQQHAHEIVLRDRFHEPKALRYANRNPSWLPCHSTCLRSLRGNNGSPGLIFK